MASITVSVHIKRPVDLRLTQNVCIVHEQHWYSL